MSFQTNIQLQPTVDSPQLAHRTTFLTNAALQQPRESRSLLVHITWAGRGVTTLELYSKIRSCLRWLMAQDGVNGKSIFYQLKRPWVIWIQYILSYGSLVTNHSSSFCRNGSSDVQNVYFREYGNTGDGASGTRVSWAGKLDAAVSISSILGSDYASQGYYDANYP